MKPRKRMLKCRNFCIYWKEEENSREMNIVVSFSVNLFLETCVCYFFFFFVLFNQVKALHLALFISPKINLNLKFREF